MVLSPIQLVKFACLSIAVLLMGSNQTYAQDPAIKYELEAQAIGASKDVVPFWMRANQFGAVPLSGASGGFIGRAYKDYQTEDEKLFDWGFGFEARANVGKNSNAQVIAAFAKVKLAMFQLKAGRSKDVMGLNGDTLLSSGNFSVSGNALGVPKVELSIPEYYRVPILGGLFSAKGNFVHGWLGRTKILNEISPTSTITYIINDTIPKTYFHQKSLYIRLGMENWRLNLYGGFNHQVFWGNEQAAYGPNFELSPSETFYHVVIGKAYGNTGVPTSKIGNQLGSIDLGASYDFDALRVMIYRQSFYDVGALSKLANINDGLNGISFENKNYGERESGFVWKKLLFEFFYSKDQAGYPWSKFTKSGDEDYYNNFYYVKGWSYEQQGIGNPLITPRSEARSGQAIKDAEYFINNRVVALHAGFIGSLNSWTFMTKLTYSKNYGTFGTSIYGSSTGAIRPPQYRKIFEPVKQYSFYLEGTKTLNNGYSAGFATALDRGQLLNNSLGLILKLKREF